MITPKGFASCQWSPNRNASNTRRRPEVTWSASWSNDDENTIASPFAGRYRWPQPPVGQDSPDIQW
jgi:hypothetical protein